MTFTAGQTSAPFSVPISDDNTLENAETFNVTIIHSSLPDRVTVVYPHEATVIIGNDDSKQHYRSKLRIYVTGFHITRLPHTQNQTYVFTRNGLLV